MLSLLTFSMMAQPERATLELSPEYRGGAFQSAPLDVPLAEAVHFLAFSVTWSGSPGLVSARFAAADGIWGDWQALPMEGHAEQSPEKRVSVLHFAPADTRKVQVAGTAGMDNLTLHFFNPGESSLPDAAQKETLVEERSPVFCPCPQPAYEGRDDWCPSGTCPEDPTPATTSVTHLIVHHAAGTNTASDWAAVVRAIWDFHTGVNGWDDVGYNWLIDPNGVIYEGRGDNRLGAHFCGTNGSTMGVCMLGDYTNITPTVQAKAALAQLLAWKSCDIGADPLGTSFHGSSGLSLMHISGHRDGCSTACPGDAFYPELPEIRDAVVAYIASSCAAIAPPANLTAAPMSDTTVVLNWEDASDNETAFLIERATSFFGDYVQIGEAPADAVSYTDDTVEPQSGYYYQVRATDGQDTSLYTNKAFAFVNIVSTADLLHGQRVEVFPNPVAGVLQVRWESPFQGPLHVRLMDTASRLIRSGEVRGGALELSWEMGTLPPGLYLLELTQNGQRAVFRVVKE